MDIRAVSDDFKRLQVSIRADANPVAIKRKLSRGLNAVSRPVRAEMTAAIPAALPRRNGLGAEMQSHVRSTTSATRGGVAIRFRSVGHDIRTLVDGRGRHPVWGNRRKWVTQTEGFNPDEFTGEFVRQWPTMHRAVAAVVDDISREVTHF